MKREEKAESCTGSLDIIFRERKRVSSLSLGFSTIRPSAVFGTRRRTALRGKGFTLVPDLGSFLKLSEVGVSPYLGFHTLCKCFSMFRLVEALNGRLIGPKTWDRSVRIFGSRLGNLGTVMDYYGFMCDELCYNSCICLYEAEIG